MDALRNELVQLHSLDHGLSHHRGDRLDGGHALSAAAVRLSHRDRAGSESSERFKVMERRLLKGIINPSMIAVWILGPLLAWLTGAYLDTWLQIKFVLVIILSGLHGCYVRCWRGFAEDRNTHSAPLLQDHQRSAGGADGADRDPGQGPAFWRLTGLMNRAETLIADAGR